MIKTFLTRPQTTLLLDQLDLDRRERFGSAQKVVHLLNLGANPWAMHKRYSVFSLLMTTTPYPEAIDAWFKAAGDLTKAPWTKHHCPSPLRDVVENVSQTDVFKERLVVRMMEAGVSAQGADLPESSLLEHAHFNFRRPQWLSVLREMVRLQPHLLTTPQARAFIESSSVPEIQALKALAPADTTPDTKAPGRKLRW